MNMDQEIIKSIPGSKGRYTHVDKLLPILQAAGENGIGREEIAAQLNEPIRNVGYGLTYMREAGLADYVRNWNAGRSVWALREYLAEMREKKAEAHRVRRLLKKRRQRLAYALKGNPDAWKLSGSGYDLVMAVLRASPEGELGREIAKRAGRSSTSVSDILTANKAAGRGVVLVTCGRLRYWCLDEFTDATVDRVMTLANGKQAIVESADTESIVTREPEPAVCEFERAPIHRLVSASEAKPLPKVNLRSRWVFDLGIAA